MKPYPNYKPSGVDWLGDVPEHWGIKRLKFAADLINQKTSVEDSDLAYIGLEHIQSWTGKKIDGEINNSEGTASKYQPNDVLFGKLRPYLAKVYLAEEKGLISSEALVIRSHNELSPKFLKYFILNRDFIDTVDSSTFGSKMPRADWEFIGNLPMLLPNIEEQTAIANFLDRKTAEIDGLIARKRLLLEKLAEKRTALISHTVTRGLNADVSLKESGVAWLGEVPEHWEIKRLKFATDLINQKTSVEDSDLAYIGLEHIQSWTGKKIDGEINNSEGTASKYQPNDVLFGKLRPYLAKVYLAEEKGLISSEALVIRSHNELSPKFLKYFILNRDFIDTVDSSTFGSKMPRADWEFIGNLPMLLPNIEEQTAIANYLDEQTALIDRQMQTIETAIEKLNEYRTALISQAVSGKIDVR